MAEAEIQELLEEIQNLKEKLRDREAALPAHSVRPHQIQEIEELEEKIAALEGKLAGMIKD
ncbi:MAG: histidine kinase [Deltaproteobacteria bacterium]|jgi:chromosome segregation ATPase|nr:histidine kinase [Deltaproteobacteria bacterium]PNV85656.1 MAG: histidine kinase [Desulfobacteraceae bacterium]MDH3802892.1 histidine kinase [Deltaproteobacteria bacterium]MDH3849747.1 histidine kinase [Deltaproteobacteria bacterium]MDH3896509.1 histidine kinase [Deltaproteobacteria bacterium]